MWSTCLHLPTLVSLLQRIQKEARESQSSETPNLIPSSAAGCQSNFTISILVHLLYNRDNIYNAREDARTWHCSWKCNNRTHRDWQEHEDLLITHLGQQSASQDTWKKRGSFVFLCTFFFLCSKIRSLFQRKFKPRQTRYILINHVHIMSGKHFCHLLFEKLYLELG